MTDELVGRLDSPAAQRIAPFATLAIEGPIPMRMEIDPTIRTRFGGLLGVSLHAVQAPKHRPHLAQIQPCEGRFGPLQGLHRSTIVRLDHLVEVLRTVV